MEFIGKDSDEEGEEVQEQTKPIADVKDVNNDDQSPSSSSSSESSSSDEESDHEGENDDDDDDNKTAIPMFPRTKNEILPHEMEEKEDDAKHNKQLNEINASMAIVKIGKILNVVDKNIVCQHLEDTEPLDHGSILCVVKTIEQKEVRVPIGVIDEVFGPVNKPMYVVRLPKEKSILLNEMLENIDDMKSKMNVYVVKQFAQRIDPRKLNTRGSDASNRYDEEVDEEEQDFSDDEKEASARNKKKNRNKKKHGNNDNNNNNSGNGNGNRRRVKVRSNRGGRQRYNNNNNNSHNNNNMMRMMPPQGMRMYGQQQQQQQQQQMMMMMQQQQQQQQRPPLLGPPSAYMNMQPFQNQMIPRGNPMIYQQQHTQAMMMQQQHQVPQLQQYNPYQNWQPPPKPPPPST